MQLIITSQNRATLETWRRVLVDRPEVTFQLGSRAEVHVDAVAMAIIFAERYGSRPCFHHAQILENRRGDGMPNLIVVPPSRPTRRSSEGRWEVHPDYRETSPSYHAASHIFRAIAEWNDSHDAIIDVIEFDLPLLGMDDPADDPTPQSFKIALEEHMRSGG